jgi:hypothetical protein
MARRLMENGDILVTEISDAWISRITRDSKVVWSVKAPNMHVTRPTPFPRWTASRSSWPTSGSPVAWSFLIRRPARLPGNTFVKEGEGMLDHSSIARELPDTGDILVVDDLNDRVIVIDRKTKAIIWQYGEKGKKGLHRSAELPRWR